jgi:hypothetical protein
MKNFNRLVGLFSSLFLATYFLIPSPAIAAGVGCGGSRPTSITGTITGYGGSFDNWTVNVLVGMDLHDGNGKKVKPDGSAAGSGYSYTDAVSPNLTPPGQASGGDRSIGVTNGTAPLCVASNVRTVWFETYPKDQSRSGITDRRYYGQSNDQRMPVSVGGTNRYSLRIPTNHANGGNTGDVNGYIKHNGTSIPAPNLSFRVFAAVAGTSCGVQGFASSADNVGTSTGQHATYYLIKSLAGGQCGAARQDYKMTVTCTHSACGPSSVSKTVVIRIPDGARPRYDLTF